MRTVAVMVLMDLPSGHPYHKATVAALGHAAAALMIPIDVHVVSTDTINDAGRTATSGSAIVIGPGSPYREPDLAIEVVREARERNIPLVGT